MGKVPRRKFLAFLSTIPIISEWMGVLGYAQEAAPDPEWEDKYLAVETLRLINTLEKWNFLATSQHISKDELAASKAYQKLADLPRVESRTRS